MLDGTSEMRLFASGIHCRDGHRDYVGVADWDLRFSRDIYNISGTLVSTRAGPVADRQSGYLVQLEFDKRGGWLETEAGLAVLSPRTDINDLGFLRCGDLLPDWGEVQFFRWRPIGPFRKFDLSFEGQAEWNHDRLLMIKSIAHTYLKAEDLVQAQWFYCDVLRSETFFYR